MNIVSKDDLITFRKELLMEMELLLRRILQQQSERPQGYRTKDLRAILGCSVNTLRSLCIARKIRSKKIGGTLYYNKEDVRKLLEEGFR